MESGVSLLIGTRSAELRPTGRRAFGAKIDAANSSATVFLPAFGAEIALANLKDNGQIAATFARSMDHRALQIKAKRRLHLVFFERQVMESGLRGLRA